MFILALFLIMRRALGRAVGRAEEPTIDEAAALALFNSYCDKDDPESMGLIGFSGLVEVSAPQRVWVSSWVHQRVPAN